MKKKDAKPHPFFSVKFMKLQDFTQKIISLPTAVLQKLGSCKLLVDLI